MSKFKTLLMTYFLKLGVESILSHVKEPLETFSDLSKKSI